MILSGRVMEVAAPSTQKGSRSSSFQLVFSGLVLCLDLGLGLALGLKVNLIGTCIHMFPQ